MGALFDTHAFVKRLSAAGMPESQAEVLADEYAHLLENRLATKEDLDQQTAAQGQALEGQIGQLRQDLETQLREQETRLDARIQTAEEQLRHEIALNREENQKIRAEIFRWMLGVLVAQTALIVSLIKLLP